MFRKLILGLLIFAATVLPETAAAFASDWQVNDFHSEITINKDSSIVISEKIVADFSQTTATKRGIIRYIPIVYKDRLGQNLDLRFELISVTDQNGKQYETLVENQGANISIRVGTPTIYVNGQVKEYNITYKILRGINPFDDHDELYWNVTGNGWDVPILKSSATIKIPENSGDKNSLLIKCFTGNEGSALEDCTSEAIDSQTVSFNSNQELPSLSGLTIVFGFPKDIVNFPGAFQISAWFLWDNWGYLIALITFFVMYYLWTTRGKDPKSMRSALMVEYEAPEGLTPAEAGTLFDDKVDGRDITSCIIDLAIRGYLKIHETMEKGFFGGNNFKYTIEDLKKSRSDLAKHEKQIIDALFTNAVNDKVNLDSLKNSFYTYIPGIKEAIYDSLISQKIYSSNPEQVKKTYLGFGGGVILVTLFFLTPIAALNVSIFLGILFSGIIISIFGFFMPKKTQKGVNTLAKVKGFEEFIATAETDRIKFYEKENIFEKVLPYAIAFNLGEKWAKVCKEFTKEKMDWFNSNNPNFIHSFNNANLFHALNNFNSNLGNNMYAAPRSTSSSSGFSGFSSGGGFSGGGFGGGGGSSW